MTADYVDLGLLADESLVVNDDEAMILDSAKGSFVCLVFGIDLELLARIELIAGGDAFKSETHQALVLNHLLELGTKAKEAELASEAGQERLF